ncbi:MAG: aminotransferase class IV family protein [Pelagimonas sp.]
MESPLHPTQDPSFRLIETFGYHPRNGIARASLHVSRMVKSATDLGMPHDRDAIETQLTQINGDNPLRCRLTLSPTGALELTTAPMPVPSDQMRFVISDVRLTSSDPLLRYKTSRRASYDQARAALPEGIQEAILLNERDEVCEGTITNIAITTPQGDRLTPPLSSGCLAGVYRQSQLDAGTLKEAQLSLQDLAEAPVIHLINSLRGATPAFWARECGQFIRIA